MKIRSGKDKAWYGISRVKQRDGVPGLLATIKRQGIHVRKHWTLSHFESPEAALKAAQDWRDRVLALLPPMTYRDLHTLVRRNNKSGIPGVFRSTPARGAPCWIASGEVAGKKFSRQFSIARYGEDEAKRRAIEARQTMLAAVPGRFWVATETSLDLTTQTFADPDAVASQAVVWDASARERFLALLESEGLVAKPDPAPRVNRRDFVSQRGPVWEATFKRPDGKTMVRRFSVKKYGEAAAERLAREAYVRLEEEFRKK